MTSIADVEAVWVSNVFEHADILAITTSILDHEYQADTQTELEELYQEGALGIGELNFFEYEINKSEAIIEVGGAQAPEYKFDVDVRYTRALDVEGNTQKQVIAAIETLCDTVRTQMGATWGSLNARTALEITPAQITKEEINGTPCYRQSVRFTAFKQ